VGVTPLKFHQDLLGQKTTVPGHVSLILCLAVFVELRFATDGQTDRQTQACGIYRANIASRGKIGQYFGELTDKSIVARFTRATLARVGISCRRVSVCPSDRLSEACVLLKGLNVGSREQLRTIARALKFSDAKNLGKTQTASPQRRRQMQVGYVKCRCGRCKLATFDAKRCQLSSVASLSH